MNNKLGLSNILQLYMQDFFISKNFNAYYNTAPKQVKVPYLCYSIKQNSYIADGNYGKVFELTIDVYDEKTSIEINNILDSLSKYIYNLYECNNHFSIVGDSGNGRIEIEEDSPIKHKRETFILKVYENRCFS